MWKCIIFAISLIIILCAIIYADTEVKYYKYNRYPFNNEENDKETTLSELTKLQAITSPDDDG